MKRCLLAICFLFCTIACTLGQRNCGSQVYLQDVLQSDPSLAKKLADVEAFINKPRSTTILNGSSLGDNETLPIIKIPVVVHILYNTAVENISDAQIKSQIDALNKDYQKVNADTSKTPLAFKSLAANCSFEFGLAVVDPRGRATNGIIRTQTSIQYFGLDDRIKSSAIGGDDPWDPDNYLNIWVGNLAGGVIGYSSVMGGPKEKDGVVVAWNTFGTVGTVSPPFEKGRTATHEIGHWMGLRHIWGDQYCGDDYVADTPSQQTSSTGCPSGVVITCNNAPYGGNMYMNYMDLSYDACMNLFTKGQRDRMRNLFSQGGPRYALLSSKGLTGTPIPISEEAPVDSAIRTSISVYPNPAVNSVTVDVHNDGSMTGKMISVYNHLGQLVMQQRISKGVSQLSVYRLQDGIYFIKVGEGKNVFKFIKAGGLRP
jgi:hypothetical protein